jgi:hypothetical protein
MKQLSSKTTYAVSELTPMTSSTSAYVYQPVRSGLALPCLICKATGRFAFARIRGKACLVKGVPSTELHMSIALKGSSSLPVPLTPSGAISSALAAVDVIVFQHEFLTIFRYSHCEAVHPSDFHLLEYMDQRFTRCDGENCRVFSEESVVERLRKMTNRRR